MTQTTTHAAGPAARLADHVTGPVILPGHDGYDQARQVFNARFDRRPAAVVRAADLGDVVATIRFARDHGLDLAVRGGGHSMAGHGTIDGGVVLDLSPMGRVDLDPAGRTAWAQAGVTAGRYTAAAHEHGLATGFGDSPGVGIAGLTLGGGIGWLARKHGLTADQLLATELVTADGDVLQVDAETQPDLFWALRGGGGNVGVVTRLRYRLHEVATVLGGMLLLPASPQALQEFVAIADAAPDELSTIVHVGKAPPLPFVPEAHHGRLVMIVMLVYAGDLDAGERVVAPIRGIAEPIVDALRPMPYPAMFEEEGPPRAAMAVRSTFLDDLDDATATLLFDHLDAATTPMSAVQLRVLGGALGRVPVEATAFAHRRRRMLLNVVAASEQPDDPAREAWVVGLLDALRPATTGAFVNFMADEDTARVAEAYPHGAYERLAAIKARYDPTNLFRGNHNITP